ncbi:GH3 auxin-responsive promoter family protein [Halobacteriovorax sp. JY17]|uniref:GH3 family domain-containing protein n=1 Tax=Halobacteriovorax sp. JY17 TaxID=2014617 RepID=UPI000C3C801A|nr:GH3 auxin-responsive promoter family protein [Halobacteriovorax sp. JY17]PIK15765.1 MAG: hypothetical protein CES88_03290 [Halobacteriovorax sp. JY17]
MIKLLFTKIFITLYQFFFKSTYTKFLSDLESPEKVQDQTLEDILELYNASPIAENLKLRNYEDFRTLPISDYADIEEDLKDHRLFPREVKTFEKTSGSSGKNKLIPYSKELLKSFQKLFIIWTMDILSHIKFEKLTFYFSISPQFKELNSKAENEYETLESDKDYLGPLLSNIGSPFFVEVPFIRELKDPYEFKLLLSLYLISRRDLEIISIWSPSFLTELCHFIKENESTLIKLLNKGEYKEKWKFKTLSLERLTLQTSFPSLKFISSWGSVNAREQFKELEELFPNVTIQRKGLLATEAPITLPLFSAKGFLPILSEVFFEFLNEEGNILRLHQLEVGGVYEIIISQKGGLYRYRIKDQIIVTHFYKSTPCFDFYGRRDALSDLVGEKLHERDIQDSFKDTSAKVAIPSLKGKCYYILSSKDLEIKEKEKIQIRLEENYHYQNSIKLGQLKSLQFLTIKDCQEKISIFYQEVRKINKGDQKLSQLLYRESDDELINYLLGLDQDESSNRFK